MLHCTAKDLSIIDLFDNDALRLLLGSGRALSLFCMAEDLSMELRLPCLSELEMLGFGKMLGFIHFVVEILLSHV